MAALSANSDFKQVVTVPGLLDPGKSATTKLNADDADYLTVAAILIPTNDGFLALNGVRIPKGEKRSICSSPRMMPGRNAMMSCDSRAELCRMRRSREGRRGGRRRGLRAHPFGNPRSGRPEASVARLEQSHGADHSATGAKLSMKRIAFCVAAAMMAIGLHSEVLSSADAYRLVGDLMASDPDIRNKARERLIEANDRSVAPALTEILFFSAAGRDDAATALEALLGERHGRIYRQWIETIGRHEEIIPKPGYVAFKARLYSQIDPAFANFFQERFPRTIRLEEIVFGGVKKDGIPALRNPRFIGAAQAAFMTPGEKVFGVHIRNEDRAYPLRILDWHEMANDVIDGQTVSLAYCTLCGSGILYQTTLAPGESYTFGSSGLLYRSNKLMYDHQTNTLWSQLTGEPVMGPLVGKRKKLPILPMTLTTWSEWRKWHPETMILSLDTGYRRDYRPGAAYGEYFASPDTMFPVWKRSSAPLKQKDWIWVLDVDGIRKAYPMRALVKSPVLNDFVRRTSVVIVTDPASEAVRAYGSRGRQFRQGVSGTLVDTRSGEKFTVDEDALTTADGAIQLKRLPGHAGYWFGWYAFYPGAEVYGLAK
jgi:hypothetical protein